MRRLRVLVIALALGWPAMAAAVQVGALETRWDWQLGALRFEGTHDLDTRTLRDTMLTKSRPWYAPWRALPAFDPGTFESDVERLVLLYRSHGYYRAHLGYDLELPAEGNTLEAVVYVDEDRPVHVTTVTVDGVDAERIATLRTLVPLDPGDVFVEADYRAGEAAITTHLREQGFARVAVHRSAAVDVDADTVHVRYQVTPGPPCTFGPVTIAGTRRVDPAVVRRELQFAQGAPFRESRIEQTRAKLAALNLFQTIRFEEGGTGDAAVPIRIVVSEAPPRDVRFGIGYDTEEQVRGLASWRHYDFLGGARQLGVTARASFLRYTLLTDFLQPHFPAPSMRFRAIVLAQREDEDGYTLDRARLLLREEWEPRPSLTAYAFYRLEYDSLANVPLGLTHALPDGVPANASQSAVGVGVEWAQVDDPLDPTRGVALKGSLEPVGGVLGGDLSFLRVLTEAQGWVPLPLDSVLALRIRYGSADPFGDTRRVPLYERFYSGGTGSVRGYDRRRIGRLVDSDPLGGESLAEVSVEARHHFTATISGVVFVDGGQLAERPWGLPFDDPQLGTGLGVRYRSPVGPIQADLGFPLDRQGGDRAFQIHVGIGGTF